MRTRQVHFQRTIGSFGGCTPITDRTIVFPKGYGQTFIHLLDGNRVIIIDPGVTRKFMMQYYFTSLIQTIGPLISEVVGNKSLEDFLKSKSNRLKLIDRLVKSDAMRFKDARTTEESVLSFQERAIQLSEFIRSNGLELVAILLTHHHIDHLGAAMPLSLMFDPPVPAVVSAPHFIQDNLLLIGTFPLSYPSNGFQYTGYPDFSLPEGIEIVDVSGHTNMIGILLPDGCFIVGDALASESAWKKTVIYLEDSSQHLASLDRLKTVPFSHLLLNHSSIPSFQGEDATSLIEFNRSRVLELKRLLRGKSGNALELADEMTQNNGNPLTRLEQMIVIAQALNGYS